MVLAPEHALVTRLMDNPQVAEYVERAAKKSDLERIETSREKGRGVQRVDRYQSGYRSGDPHLDFRFCAA